MLSTTCQYAIRAMIAIAHQKGGGYVSARRIGAVLDIPTSFLAKVLLRLTSADLLESRRGPQGGVRLARSAAETHLGDIVRAIDGREALDSCVYGWPDCSRATPCPLHAAWGFWVDPFVERLDSTTLEVAAGLISSNNGAHKSDKRLVNQNTSR